MDKDNYTGELLLQTTDICFISYACRLGRVKSLFLDLEEKGSSPSESDAQKSENKVTKPSNHDNHLIVRIRFVGYHYKNFYIYLDINKT